MLSQSYLNRKIIFIVFIVFIVFFAVPSKTLAADDAIREEVLRINDKIQERKQEILELNKQIEVLKDTINKKKREATTLENQIQIITSRVSHVELDIQATEKEIEAHELEIDTLGIEKREGEIKIKQEKEIIAEVIRRLYKTTNVGTLELLLLNDDLSNFFAHITTLETLEKGLADKVTTLQELNEAIGSRTLAIETDKSKLEKIKNSLEGKKIYLREAQAAKEVLVSATIKSARESADNLSEILRQKEAIDNEVFNLQTKIQEKLNTSDKFSFSGNILLSWPVPNQGIVTRFMDPDYPFRNFFEHTGLDIRTLRNGRPSNGIEVKATAPGIVIKVVRESIYGGNIIYIAHAGAITTVYMHLSRMLVGVGDEVARGDLVGYSGGMPGTPGSGRFTTGPHLHFEVRKNGIPVNPLDYLINF